MIKIIEIFQGPRSRGPLWGSRVSGPEVPPVDVPGLTFSVCHTEYKEILLQSCQFLIQRTAENKKHRTTEKVNNLSGSRKKRGFMIENGVYNKTFKEDWTEIFPHVTGFLLRIAGYPLLLFPMNKLFKGGKNLSRPFFFLVSIYHCQKKYLLKIKKTLYCNSHYYY